jgi:MoxR-like ATPase
MAHPVSAVYEALHANVTAVVRGKPEQIRLALCCLLSESHLLIDDVPGTGKTSLAKAVAGSIAGTWKRVQFTPDLLPSDISGVMVFDQRTSEFSFRRGPVFTNVLVGDEINRASPKTQSALLEVMEERQVTADGIPYPVMRPFFVIATQNPKDSSGTFPLPDVQLDRFAMRLELGYLDSATEVEVLMGRKASQGDFSVEAVTNATELAHAVAVIDEVDVVQSVADYIVRVANATRVHPDLRLGVSTRGTLSMMRIAKAYAATEQRTYVTPDDIRELVPSVFSHRIAVSPEAELRGVRAAQVLAEVVDDIPVPRQREA